ncbi:MAG: V-type ATP synthase subunit A, partial [Treponema sp.]|nr:V-type ATP synthase subunit A [Treponema sp.]
MKDRIIGRVRRVNGPVIEADGITDARMLELVQVGESRLVGEVLKLSGDRAIIQVYEDTTGLAPRDNVYGAGMPLSLELGPGLIGSIYDGIQRPLERLRALSGDFIESGITAEPLDRSRTWRFVPDPELKPGAPVSGGRILGTVRETSRVEHRILVPPELSGTLESLVPEGDYPVDHPVAVVRTDSGPRELPLFHRWPIRTPRPVRRRLPLSIPLITG